MSLSSLSFGVSIEPTWDQQYSLAFAKKAEELDYSNIWVPDSGPVSPFCDPLVTLSAIASSTRKIKFGSAILNFYTRNPAQIASSFLTLSSLAKGRPVLGIGLGSSYHVSKFGVFSRKGMVEDMREAVESIRELFEGKEVSVRTDSFIIERVELSKSKTRIPVYIGASSPKGLKLAGEIADGVILADRIAGEIEQSTKPLTLGLSESSRSRKDLHIVNSVVISVSRDGKKAKQAAKVTCAYLAAWLDEKVSIKYGIDENKRKEIAQQIYNGNERAAAKLVDHL